MGFTTSLRVQKRDLEQGIRLAWQEYDMNKEAVRCTLNYRTVYIYSIYMYMRLSSGTSAELYTNTTAYATSEKWTRERY